MNHTFFPEGHHHHQTVTSLSYQVESESSSVSVEFVPIATANVYDVRIVRQSDRRVVTNKRVPVADTDKVSFWTLLLSDVMMFCRNLVFRLIFNQFFSLLFSRLSIHISIF